MSDLASCIGQEEINLLAAFFGAGQRLYVPSSTANAAHLEIILGLPATSALINAFGGNYVYLPGLPRHDGKPRPPSLATVAALSAPGPRRMSASAIARKFRVSVRSIYHKRAEVKRRLRLGIPLDARKWTKNAARKKRAREKQRSKANGGQAAVRLSRSRELAGMTDGA